VNLRQIIRIVKSRYKLAALVMMCAVGVTLAVTKHLPKQYAASTSLIVDVRNRDPIAAMLTPGSMGTQIDIIKSDLVALKVIKLLKLDRDPEILREWREHSAQSDHGGQLEAWLAQALEKGLNVTPGRDSNIISIEYKASNPALAAEIANAYARAYIDATIELKVDPAKQYARWYSEQGKELRENLESAQARLSRYQQEKGIVAKDEKLDTETARLADLTNRLTIVQEQTADARSKQRSGAASDTLPEVLGNPVIMGLRSEIARQEGKLKDAEVSLGSNHPQILRMKSELAELKANLDAETRHVTRGFSASSSVGREKETELRAAIEAQKKKLLKLKSERDQLAGLQRDVDLAQSAYDSIAARYNQLNLESRFTQASVSVLTPAAPPANPFFPKPLRVMLLLAAIFGAALGVGAALGLEMLDPRIRSADDLGEMLQLPVLGVVQRATGTRRAGLPHRPAPLALK